MAHAQKRDLVFQRNGRVHLYRRGCQFSRLLAAEACASAVVMLDRPCPIQCKTAGYPLHSPLSPSLLLPRVSVCHQIPFPLLTEVCVQCPIWLFLCFVYVFSCYVAEVFSEWFWNGSICPNYYRYRFCLYTTYALYFCCKVFIFSNLLWFFFLITFLSPEIAISINIHVPLLLARIVMSDLLLGMVLSVVVCYLALAGSLMWLPYLNDWFLLILVRAYTSVRRSQWPLACLGCGFESHRGHGRLSWVLRVVR